jgi:chloramphenicol 3-O-phosphotransferase
MIDKLDRLVEETTSLNSKLVLLIGSPRSGKSGLLVRLSERRKTQILNVGAALGRQLVAIPNTRRHLHAAELLKELAD